MGWCPLLLIVFRLVPIVAHKAWASALCRAFMLGLVSIAVSYVWASALCCLVLGLLPLLRIAFGLSPLLRLVSGLAPFVVPLCSARRPLLRLVLGLAPFVALSWGLMPFAPHCIWPSTRPLLRLVPGLAPSVASWCLGSGLSLRLVLG